MSSAAIRRRAACRSCARPCARWLRAALPAGRRASIPRPWCCRSTARARRCSPSCRRWSTAPARRRWCAMPNPFYQIYEGAALLAGAEPYYLDTTAANRFLPTSMPCRRESGSAARCCSCAPPAIRPARCCRSAYLQHALELAERHDFVIASDECYADSTATKPRRHRQPAAARRWPCGRDRFERCMVFHSAVEALERAGPALRLRGRRSRAHAAASCCTAPTTAAPCRCPRSSPASPPGTTTRMSTANRALLPREVRRACCRSCAGARRHARPTAASTCGPTSAATTKPSRATCTRSRTSPSCPAATWRATRRAGNPGARPRAHLARCAGVDECVEAAATHPRLHLPRP